jgi:hypothetical protein
VTADGLTVDGAASIGSSTAKTKFYSDSTYNGIYNGASLYANESIYMGGGNLYFFTATDQRMLIAANGDISFYEDTGTTAKFFWDASAESLGIGTTSPATALSIVRSYTGGSDTGYPHIYLNNTAAQGNGSTTFNQAMLRVNAGDGAVGFLRATYDSAGPYGTSIDLWSVSNIPLRFATNNTERMRIDSSGNVGIGTSSPAAGLHIDNPSNGAITAILDTDNTAVKLVFRNNTETGNNVQIGADGSSLVALTNATERMRIDSNGALLLGATSRLVYYNSVNGYNASAVIKTNASNEVADLVITNANNDFGSSVDFARTNSAGNDVRFATISAQPTNTTAGSEAGVIRFYTKDTGDSNVVERMRITDTGSVLVGKTAANTAVDGIELNSGDVLVATRNNDAPLILNRRTSDGDIVVFRKDTPRWGVLGLRLVI